MPEKDPWADPREVYGVKPLYGPQEFDLPGQVVGPPPRVVLGSGDWRDIPGMVELGNIDISTPPEVAPHPVVVKQGDRFVVTPPDMEPGNHFGVFWDADTARDYAARIAHEVDVAGEVGKIYREGGTEYAKAILDKEKTPLKSGQYRGPIGEFPQPLSKKMRAMIRVGNYAP